MTPVQQGSLVLLCGWTGVINAAPTSICAKILRPASFVHYP